MGKIKELRSKYEESVAELEKITTAAVDEKGEVRAFTPEESEARGALKASIQTREDDWKAARKAKRDTEKQERAALARMGFPAYETNGDGSMKVNSEHKTYERGNGLSYLQDLVAVGFGPGIGGKFFAASERLRRHGVETYVEAKEAD